MFTGWVTAMFTLQLIVYTVAISSVNKIVINDNIFMHPNLSDNFLDFITKNNIEYYELDDLSIICFVNTNIPELVENEYITNIYIKNL